MNLEDKIDYFREVTLSDANAQVQAALSEYEKSLQSVYQQDLDFEKEKYNSRLQVETQSLSKELNKEKAQTTLVHQRKLSRLQEELKGQIFQSLMEKLLAFKLKPEYRDYLISLINHDRTLAPDNDMIFYLDPSDVPHLDYLVSQTKQDIRISDREFIGGIRGVVENRHILMDDSFKSQLDHVMADFSFDKEMTQSDL